MAQTTPSGQHDHGSGIAIAQLRADARELSPERFEDRHGGAFLMLTAAELRSPNGPSMTEVNLAGDEEPGEHTAGLSLVAFPVRRSERSVGHLVTIGRTANNDLVIPDISVSRFHAFAKEIGDGRFAIQDAGSTNGTTVNGSSVPAQGAGDAVALKSGDNVRIGQMELTFLDLRGMLDFLVAHER
jgi:pSer/pThr/pTyr-binding forkhead associated (FHA) protein